MEAITKVLISTAGVLLSKKLFQDYKQDKDILVGRCKINRLLQLGDVQESHILEDGMVVCFDENLNSVGIIKSGIAGHVMPIADSNLTLINLYKPFISETFIENNCTYQIKLNQTEKNSIMRNVVFAYTEVEKLKISNRKLIAENKKLKQYIKELKNELARESE